MKSSETIDYLETPRYDKSVGTYSIWPGDNIYCRRLHGMPDDAWREDGMNMNFNDSEELFPSAPSLPHWLQANGWPVLKPHLTYPLWDHNCFKAAQFSSHLKP